MTYFDGEECEERMRPSRRSVRGSKEIDARQ